MIASALGAEEGERADGSSAQMDTGSEVATEGTISDDLEALQRDLDKHLSTEYETGHS